MKPKLNSNPPDIKAAVDAIRRAVDVGKKNPHISEEIKSTSDVLMKWFGLPAGGPGDHLLTDRHRRLIVDAVGAFFEHLVWSGSGRINAVRTICLNEGDALLEHLKPGVTLYLGDHWSFSGNRVLYDPCHGELEIIVTTTISCDDIDWSATVEANIASACGFWYEREICLKEGTSVYVEQIYSSKDGYDEKRWIQKNCDWADSEKFFMEWTKKQETDTPDANDRDASINPGSPDVRAAVDAIRRAVNAAKRNPRISEEIKSTSDVLMKWFGLPTGGMGDHLLTNKHRRLIVDAIGAFFEHLVKTKKGYIRAVRTICLSEDGLWPDDYMGDDEEPENMGVSLVGLIAPGATLRLGQFWSFSGDRTLQEPCEGDVIVVITTTLSCNDICWDAAIGDNVASAAGFWGERELVIGEKAVTIEKVYYAKDWPDERRWTRKNCNWADSEKFFKEWIKGRGGIDDA